MLMTKEKIWCLNICKTGIIVRRVQIIMQKIQPNVKKLVDMILQQNVKLQKLLHNQIIVAPKNLMTKEKIW